MYKKRLLYLLALCLATVKSLVLCTLNKFYFPGLTLKYSFLPITVHGQDPIRLFCLSFVFIISLKPSFSLQLSPDTHAALFIRASVHSNVDCITFLILGLPFMIMIYPLVTSLGYSIQIPNITFSQLQSIQLSMTRNPTVLHQTNYLLLFTLLLCLISANSSLRTRFLTDSPIKVSSPSSFDWRSNTAMTPVKNQADCNAYYAFSTIAFLQQDAILFEKAPANIDLSEQFLTTCLPNGGCVGGNPKDAMEFAIKKGGIPTESAYPYTPYALQPEEICFPSNPVNIGTRPMVSYFNVEDQEFLKSLLLKQPLNIYICSQDMKSYAPKSNSERTLSCNQDNFFTDHSVLLVGYTETEWIIKNSWSTSWGLEGYGYISRNPENDCCIGTQVFTRGEQSQNQNCTVNNCEICVENNFCSKCKPGYYVIFQNGKHKCAECNYENCAQCENNVGYCKTCIFGFALYFPEQVCRRSVIPNCKSIVNGGCKSCHLGFRVTANYTCENDCKIQNCEMCKDDKSCSKCKAGFVLTFANNTLSCIKNQCKTQNCASCDTRGKCLSCVGSFTLEEDSCVMKCNKQNCLKCSETENICAKCTDGTALDFYSRECVPTSVANCNETYLGKYCSICQEGYQRSDSWEQCNKICAIDNCKTCQVGFANQCTSCDEGYNLKVPPSETIARCEKNPCDFANCSLCNTNGDICVKCIDEYHEWDASIKACKIYVCPLENCRKCKIGATKCEQCMEGVIPYITSGGCIESTIQFCAVMAMEDNELECRDCQSGYSVNHTTWKSCERICKDSNCIDCFENANFCKTCLDGYSIKNVSDSENKCFKIPTYMPNCVRGNSDQTVCFECKQFYYYDNVTQNCELNEGCPRNCLKCSAKNQSLKCECKSGFVWDFINEQCVVNPSDAQCLVISNFTGTPQCFQCKDGFTLTEDGKGCEDACAVENCHTCLQSEVENYPDYCQVCSDGFVVNLNLTRCLKCTVEFCKTCAGPNELSKCIECKLGYSLTEGMCVQIPCPKNSVFNGLECACSSQFYKDAQTQECKGCPQSCKRCFASDKCLECLPGFYLDDGLKCQTCLTNCEKCSSSNSCDVCEEGYTYQIKQEKASCEKVGLGRQGYFVLNSGKKARCSPGCASCAKSQFSCQQCIKGYILQDQKCRKCSDNCQTCFPNVLSACRSCQIAFSLIDGECRRCESPACIECPVQVNICTVCLPGYYVKDQTCKSCGIGCRTCSPDGKCASCHTGFAMLENGFCQQCLDGCAQCSPDALHQCKGGCLEGTYRDSNKCIPCVETCTKCESMNKCIQCIPGYDLIDGACRKWCTDWNCYDCSGDNQVCKECYAGYVLVSGNCEEDFQCNSETRQNNGTQTATNTTDNAGTNTQTDNAENTDNTNAETNTETMDNTNSNTETKTNTNTNTNTDTDTKTENTEIPTSVVGNCEVCPKKYYLSTNSTCEKCSTQDQNCIACTKESPNVCSQCGSGFFLTEQRICNNCPENCYTCRSAGFCYICSSGYFMVQENSQYSGSCVKCHENCLTCIGGPKNCLSCNKGFVLSVANLCMNQDMIMYKIRLNMPFRQFSKKSRDIRFDVNSMFGNTQNTYLMQYQIAREGSTQIEGYVSIPQNEQTQGDTYEALVKNIRGGSYIAGFEVLSASLVYNGNSYNSEKTDDESGNGWIIAVAVVGGVIGLILTVVLLTCLVKKIKSKKVDYGSEQNEEDSGKNTSQNLKKHNPELN